MLGSDGAFISFMPDNATRLSYGINHAAEAPIIGSQWFSWSPDDGEHYRWAIAPARTFAPSLEVCKRLIPNSWAMSDASLRFTGDICSQL